MMFRGFPASPLLMDRGGQRFSLDNGPPTSRDWPITCPDFPSLKNNGERNHGPATKNYNNEKKNGLRALYVVLIDGVVVFNTRSQFGNNRVKQGPSMGRIERKNVPQRRRRRRREKIIKEKNIR